MKIKLEAEIPRQAVYDGTLMYLLTMVPFKVVAQIHRAPALCDAPESHDQLRDMLGRVVGKVEVTDIEEVEVTT